MSNRFFAYKLRNPVESVLLGELPYAEIGRGLASDWDPNAVALSEVDARAIVAGELSPDCPAWARAFVARDLALMLEDVPSAKRWQGIIDFLYATPKTRKKSRRD